MISESSMGVSRLPSPVLSSTTQACEWSWGSFTTESLHWQPLATVTLWCCGYSKVLKSPGRGLLILLKLTLVSDEGAYIIVARPKAICYGRAFTFRHLVDCVTFQVGADFGRLQPAKQQCGCHGSKRRHSDLFPPSRNTNREASCYTTEQYGHRQGNRRRGCPRATCLQTCLTHWQNCECQCVAKEDRTCTAPSCAKELIIECTRDFTIGNWYEPSFKLKL